MSRLRVPFRAMASEHEIVVDHDDEAKARAAVDAAIGEVLRIERKYSRYRDDSVVTAINRAAGAAPVAIDAETAALLRYADTCHALSGGRFDVTSGVLRQAWDFKRRPPQLPDPGRLAELCALIDWKAVDWDERGVRLPRAGMELDFGGIGKEYAADRAATLLVGHGVRHALVNLGGDIRALGGQAGGRAWRIGIRHPRPAPEAAVGVLAEVELHDGAVATSGDYERHFELDGVRYCHILDARSGWPVRAWQSVSVVAPVAVVAGSCATIAMLLEGAAADFLATQGVAWLGVAADGSRLGRLDAAARDAGR
jgi:thiamine biosynthesis lipoprotein